MQFVKPVPFREAIEKIGKKTPIGSQLNSTEWSAVPVALRERAFFSSQVESVRFLQRGKDAVGDFIAGNRETLPNGQVALKTGSRAQFVRDMSAFAVAEGMGPLVPDDEGTIKDIRSQRRLDLIFDVQTQQAQDYGYWKQGMDPDVLEEFPAQRFIRVKDVKDPRDRHAEFEGQVALKSDVDFWQRINEDFGVPWGPWGWGCGHDVEDVDRDAAERMGLIKPGDRMPPVEKEFNDRLESSTAGLDDEMQEVLREAFGDQIVIKDDSARWLTQAPEGQTSRTGRTDVITPGEKVALKDYTGVEHIVLNRRLREEGKAAPIGKLQEADRINLALSKLPSFEGRVYRGVENMSAKDIERYVPGNVIEERQFISTSRDARRAFDGNATFEIVSRSGKPVKEFSSHPHEDEVLFPAGTLFRVLKVERHAPDNTKIFLEEL